MADGAGSGAYAKLPAAAISGLANPFGAQLLQVREVGQTTYGGGSFSTRKLNSVAVNEISGAVLSSSQIQLPAGTYYVDALHSEYFNTPNTIVQTQPRLRNVTSNVTLVVGFTSQYSNTIQAGTTNQYVGSVLNGLRGRFTLSGTVNIEYQVFCNNTVTSILSATGSGETGYGTDVSIWKVS